MRLRPKLSKPQPHSIRSKIPVFRIFYSGTFLIANLVLLALLLVTPGDHIHQAFKRKQLWHIIIVAAVYLLTFLVTLVIYASRLFSTRSALAAIPREVHLSDDPEIHTLGFKHGGRKIQNWRIRERKAMVLGVKVNKQVRNVVTRGLRKSAIVAFEGRPRDLSHEPPVYREIVPVMKRKKLQKLRGQGHAVPTATETQGSSAGHTPTATTTLMAVEPIWGIVEHAGWSSPGSKDLPNLHYEPVILELPNIIEAKAVSLAPIDSLSDPEGPQNPPESATAAAQMPPSEAPLLDPVVVDILRRPVSMCLRDYLFHLSSLGMISPAAPLPEFLALYEQARFSGDPLVGHDFRALMATFTQILSELSALNEDVVEDLRMAADEEAEDSEGGGDYGGEGDSVVEHVAKRWSKHRQDTETETDSINSNETTINHHNNDKSRHRRLSAAFSPPSTPRPTTAIRNSTPRPEHQAATSSIVAEGGGLSTTPPTHIHTHTSPIIPPSPISPTTTTTTTASTASGDSSGAGSVVKTSNRRALNLPFVRLDERHG